METMLVPTILIAARTFASPVPQTAVARASFSIPDSLFLVVIALVVFGPKRLPEISRKVGKVLYEFRKASNDFKFQIEEELRLAEQAERQKQLQTQAAQAQPATPVAISADETVSAASRPSGLDDPAKEPDAPTIMPPRTGETVPAPSPRGAAFSSSSLTGSTMPASEASPTEMSEGSATNLHPQAAEPDAETHADESIAEYAAADPVSPTHHG